MSIGVADTTFARVDMGKFAIDECGSMRPSPSSAARSLASRASRWPAESSSRSEAVTWSWPSGCRNRLRRARMCAHEASQGLVLAD